MTRESELELLAAGARDLGIALEPPRVEELLRLVDALELGNAQFNLTAIRDRLGMLRKHVLDSLSLQPYLRGTRIADIGTGSGAILLALLSELPKATGIGTDISLMALQAANHNAARFGLAPRTAFVVCNYASALSGMFDLIVSNPPYIRSADIAGLELEVREYDPPGALDGGVDGLDAYRAIVPQAASLLAPGGTLIVEAGCGQSGSIADLMSASGLTSERLPKTDLAGIPRAIAGRKPPR